MSHEQATSHETVTPNRILEHITHSIENDTLPFSPEPAKLFAFFRAATTLYGADKYDTYASTSITSGGAALPLRNGDTLPFGEALALNEQFACDLIDAA